MRESLGEKTSFETAQLFLVSRLAGLPFASRIESRMDEWWRTRPSSFLPVSFSSHLCDRRALTRHPRTGFIPSMRLPAALLGLISYVLAVFSVSGAEEPRIVEKVTPLPIALSKDFEFRKTKIFSLSETPLNQRERNTPSTKSKPGKLSSTSPSSKSATVQDASITFERQYRLFGAVTALDSRQRFGDYFDFFWRAKRPADITVRLEYRQEKLHEHVQAQEISYRSVRGTHKTEFKVIGDDYFDDGRVISWRCLLIENRRIVAENRSYMWK